MTQDFTKVINLIDDAQDATQVVNTIKDAAKVAKEAAKLDSITQAAKDAAALLIESVTSAVEKYALTGANKGTATKVVSILQAVISLPVIDAAAQSESTTQEEENAPRVRSRFMCKGIQVAQAAAPTDSSSDAAAPTDSSSDAAAPVIMWPAPTKEEENAHLYVIHNMRVNVAQAAAVIGKSEEATQAAAVLNDIIKIYTFGIMNNACDVYKGTPQAAAVSGLISYITGNSLLDGLCDTQSAAAAVNDARIQMKRDRANNARLREYTKYAYLAAIDALADIATKLRAAAAAKVKEAAAVIDAFALLPDAAKDAAADTIQAAKVQAKEAAAFADNIKQAAAALISKEATQAIESAVNTFTPIKEAAAIFVDVITGIKDALTTQAALEAAAAIIKDAAAVDVCAAFVADAESEEEAAAFNKVRKALYMSVSEKATKRQKESAAKA